MRRGEIWRVQLPFADGHEQAGVRPALVIEGDQFINDTPLILIVPFTSKMAAARYAATLTVTPDVGNGLTSTSVALIFQTRGLDKKRFIEKLGQVDDSTLNAVFAELDRLTGR